MLRLTDYDCTSEASIHSSNDRDAGAVPVTACEALRAPSSLGSSSRDSLRADQSAAAGVYR